MMVVPLGSVLRMSKKKLKKGKKAPSFLVMDRQTGKLIPEIIPQRVRVLMKTVYGNKIGKKGTLLALSLSLLPTRRSHLRIQLTLASGSFAVPQ
jgi:hypothetical protein